MSGDLNLLLRRRIHELCSVGLIDVLHEYVCAG